MITVAESPGPTMSLVVSTLGAAADLDRLLDSLDAQTFRDFDVVIVDQNADDRLGIRLAAQRRSFPLVHIHTPDRRGVSRGRNTGWRATRGQILLFPDDNCWYPVDFLGHAVAVLTARAADIVSGRAADETGQSILAAVDAVASRITHASVWTAGIEWMIVVRRSVLECIGGFDETLGVGAPTPWQACEGQDLLLRAIAAGFVCWYDPTVYGHDVTWEERSTPQQISRKARAYGRGMGYVLALHRFGLRQQVRWVGRSALGALVYAARLDRAKVSYYWQTMLGRIEGIRGFARSSGR